MERILDNLSMVMPFFIISWGIFTVSALWKPQKFRNSILLMIALFFSVFFIASLARKYMGTVLIFAFLFSFLALLLVPVMLIINGIVTIKREGKSLGHLLSLLLWLLIGAGEIAFGAGLAMEVQSFSHEYTLSKLIAAFIGSSALYFSVLILTFVLYMIFMQFVPHFRSFDYLIIHGAGLIDGDKISKLLSNRIDKAIKVFNKSKNKLLIIPSGGQGGDGLFSGISCLYFFLHMDMPS